MISLRLRFLLIINHLKLFIINFTKRIIAVFLFFSLIGFILFSSKLSPPGLNTNQFDFEISSNQPTHLIINNLFKKKLIRDTFFFKVLLMLKGKSNAIKKGVFILNRGMSAGDIINIITSGRTKNIRLTIPEGFNNRQIAKRVVELKLFDSEEIFFHYATYDKLLNEYQIPTSSVEGYIFPDTYEIPIGYAKEKIMRYFLDHFLEKTQTIEGFPQDKIERHRLITLASIVEREAKLKEEITLIAGVFTNRLKRNYPLESCATIQYLLKKPRKRLFYSHLKIKSPYNTYQNSGLPPGPISNPGINSIRAALYPQNTEFLFFVVRGDGGHVFSKTLSAHNKAKRDYNTFHKGK